MTKSAHRATSEISPDALLHVAKEPVSTAIPGEAVILDSRSGRYYSLEGVGARVWELLQDPRPLREIVRLVVDEYEVDEATCERDVRALITQLERTGLVLTTSPDHESGA